MTPQIQQSYYFAYGSNMNPNRVRLRKMSYDACQGGVLDGYRLAFNKRSEKVPGAAAANVEPAAGHLVEGLLYRLTHPAEIEVMDVFEGFPVRYRRELLPVRSRERVIAAWVYLANPEFVVQGLKPARWYLEHLLAGAPWLSSAYFQALQQTETLPDSDVEP